MEQTLIQLDVIHLYTFVNKKTGDSQRGLYIGGERFQVFDGIDKKEVLHISEVRSIELVQPSQE